MNFIVAVDNNWGIGAKNGLLYDIKGDMRYFRENTINKVVVMGENTLLSFPNSAPLKNRVNIVLSENDDFKVENAIVVHNKVQLFKELKKYNDNEIFIIGGAYVYRQFYPYCRYGYITKINASKPAEKFFDNLDIDKNWKVIERGETNIENGIEYTFCKYENISPLKY